MSDVVISREQLSRDARNRALRTLLQNLAIDILVAVVMILWPLLDDANSLGDFEWTIIAFTVGKTVVATIFSFIMRRFLDPSRFPTPLPPAPLAAPAEPADPEPLGPGELGLPESLRPRPVTDPGDRPDNH